MDKPIIKDHHAGQFLYLGRWVDKATFCAFVYDKDGNEKLANNYQNYQAWIASGLWFSSKPNTLKKPRKAKDANLSDSK